MINFWVSGWILAIALLVYSSDVSFVRFFLITIISVIGIISSAYYEYVRRNNLFLGLAALVINFVFFVGYVLQYLVVEACVGAFQGGSDISISFCAPVAFFTFSIASADVDAALVAVVFGQLGILFAVIFAHLTFAKNFTRCQMFDSAALGLDFIKVWILVGVYSATAIPRYYFDIFGPNPAVELPLKLNGVLNLTNGYLVFFLLSYNLWVSAVRENADKWFWNLVIGILISVVSILLFKAKTPLFLVLFSGFFSGMMFPKFPVPRVAMLATPILLVGMYPVLNFLRYFESGLHGDLISASYDYAVQTSEVGRSWIFYFVNSVVTIIMRFSGFEPLVILVKNNGIVVNYFDYIFSFIDTDSILTYDIAGYATNMGFSSGFIGRVFFSTGSYLAVFIVIFCLIYSLLSIACRLVFKGGIYSFMGMMSYIFVVIHIMSGFRYIATWWWLGIFLGTFFIISIYLRIYASKNSLGRSF